MAWSVTGQCPRDHRLQLLWFTGSALRGEPGSPRWRSISITGVRSSAVFHKLRVMVSAHHREMRSSQQPGQKRPPWQALSHKARIHSSWPFLCAAARATRSRVIVIAGVNGESWQRQRDRSNVLGIVSWYGESRRCLLLLARLENCVITILELLAPEHRDHCFLIHTRS